MSKLDVVRNKLDKKLFNTGAVLRSSVVLSSYVEASTSFGGYSSDDSTYTSQGSVPAVPYNNIPKDFNIESFGDFQTGDMFVVFKHDTTVAIKDKVVFNGNTYFVKDIKEIIINDGIAAIIAQVRISH